MFAINQGNYQVNTVIIVYLKVRYCVTINVISKCLTFFKYKNVFNRKSRRIKKSVGN